MLLLSRFPDRTQGAKSASLRPSAFGARIDGVLLLCPVDMPRPTWTDTKRPNMASILGAITDEISFPPSIVIRHFPGPGHTHFPESPSAAFVHYRDSCPDTHSLSPPRSGLLLTRTKHTTRLLCSLHGPLHDILAHRHGARGLMSPH